MCLGQFTLKSSLTLYSDVGCLGYRLTCDVFTHHCSFTTVYSSVLKSEGVNSYITGKGLVTNLTDLGCLDSVIDFSQDITINSHPFHGDQVQWYSCHKFGHTGSGVGSIVDWCTFTCNYNIWWRSWKVEKEEICSRVYRYGLVSQSHRPDPPT